MLETKPQSAGRYRRWDGVKLQGTVLFSTRPLAVTRLNDAGAAVVEALGTQSFETPSDIAAKTDVETEAVAQLLDRLHRRGFLEWAPNRDESFVPPVSIIVTVRNERDALEDCLDAIDALDYPAYEVVLVDDGSTDGTGEIVRTHRLADGDRLRVVDVGSSTEPLGIGASRNRGIDAARYDVIAFTDADCRPRSDWLSALVPGLADHDIVGGRVRPYGTKTVDAYEGVNSSLDMGEYAARVDPNGATPYLPTANFLAKRSVLEQVRFPDRNIAEDVDVCWRAIERGYDVVYDPAGVVEHEYRDNLGAFAGRRSDYGASEALLSRTYCYGERVSLPFRSLLVGIFVSLLLIAGQPLTPIGTITVGGLAITATMTVDAARRYRRLRSTITVGTFLRSRCRETLSRVYAVSTEVTRYYSLPLVLIPIGFLGVGNVMVAAVGITTVATAITLPAVVEYRIEKPDISPLAYMRFYLADHLGYQHGVYRGAISSRTLTHLFPPNRFRLIGPVITAAVAATSAITMSRRTDSDARTVSVGSVQAAFRTDTSTESWLFDDEKLRGERPVLADFLERLTPDDTVFDVGANVGLYTCFAGTTLRNSRLVAVEPYPANADRLATNLELNGIDAHIVQQAFGSTDEDGQLEVSKNQAGVGTSALAPGPEGMNTRSADADWINVTVASGDTLIERGDIPSPTVVKIDVEGAELEVLRGLEGALSRPDCRLVYCEVHPTLLESFDATSGDVESFLCNRGFVLDRIQEWDDRYLLRATRPANGTELH